ncbi:hypothetical protein [Evansella tamaricis]|uniref:Uncharacterized protein n=1 Tax=Evansella tamaricis TaxID=2069301 RepID=A0ABS6JCI3_9BACI|nr:hypothetical protein [Evansella tamaricis]MBU9711387.1 hypothetical protein [Evansella tamaricis]
MNKLLNYIGIGIFIGWCIAIFANFSIYQHTTLQITLFHPIFDAILFMGIMTAIFFGAKGLYLKKEISASVFLALLGTISITFAVLLFV